MRNVATVLFVAGLLACGPRQPGTRVRPVHLSSAETQRALDVLRAQARTITTTTATVTLTVNNPGVFGAGRLRATVAYARAPTERLRMTAYDFLGVRSVDILVRDSRVALWRRGEAMWELFPSVDAFLAAYPEATPAYLALADPLLALAGTPSALLTDGGCRAQTGAGRGMTLCQYDRLRALLRWGHTPHGAPVLTGGTFVAVAQADAPIEVSIRRTATRPELGNAPTPAVVDVAGAGGSRLTITVRSVQFNLPVPEAVFELEP